MKSKKLRGMISTLAIIMAMGVLTSCAKEEKPEEKADANTQASTTVGQDIDLEWDAQPTLGLIKGDYYKIEERFRQGHLGILEVVQNDGKIVEVEFNEMTRPNYYKRYYQDVPKRNSEYNFDMGLAKGAAWIQSVVQVEKQMIDEQRLTGEFDVVSGASNSIEQAMAPLAEKLSTELSSPSGIKYYAIAEELGGGLTGKLKVIVKDGKILECRYDEIFANSQDEIEDPELKKYYRVSKYESIEYHEPSRIGFNIQMDELNNKVVETQDMLDLTGLPAIEDTGDYKSSGYTKRNTAWDNYLKLAEKLLNEMKADNVL
ncbi:MULTISPECIES: FMN-binding protein [Clostridium]|uniref:FMN-binding protein n=1 Tax=Clostridium TaxID=1485 RepID=UPI001FAB58F9|nr:MULTISPECIES: FMN-binding protein [Clostridium]MDI9219263.1 FMN-binding protein [Clostridium tertium]